MRICAYRNKFFGLLLNVNKYYTLQGFWGDEDYYEYFIGVNKKYLDDLLTCLRKETKAKTLLNCIKEKFNTDTADFDFIDFCKKNKIPYFYLNNIEGVTSSENKREMREKIKELKAERKILRKYDYVF